MKIAIMGFGTVGSGAYDVAMAAGGIEVVKILDLVVRKGYEDIADRFTQDLTEITGDPEIELVVEAMGGVDTPRKFVLECLKAGKGVVTPNKNLISACYGELMKTAKGMDKERRDEFFEVLSVLVKNSRNTLSEELKKGMGENRKPLDGS
jgi:homoserine dehydrogenase